MHHLSNLQVAVLVSDGFEESELTEPVQALKDAGAKVHVISDRGGEVLGFRHLEKGKKVSVDKSLVDASPDAYDALLLPGGAVNADQLRMNAKVHQFIRSFQNAGKPIAAICHAPWELISAGIAKGRTMTGYYTIQDDIRNAGATYVDRDVVVDDNLVTSRQPSDIPAFNRDMLSLFARTPAVTGR